MRVLIVQSPDPRRIALALTLEMQDFVHDIAADAAEAMDFLATLNYDAVAVVGALPDSAVERLVKNIRVEKIIAPVLVVGEPNAPSSAAADHLDVGADDYVPDNCGSREIVSRLRALIRRSWGRPASTITVGPLTLDLNLKTASVDGVDLHLTGKEHALLELLVLRKGAVMTKEMILSHLYQERDEPEVKIIDVFICKLRKKLRSADVDLIRTIWGRGYSLAEPQVATASAV